MWLSTPKTACAVSTTRQTTTAAISTGLPSASETLSRAVSKFRTRTERRRLVLNGTVQWKPASRTVPTYRPKNCTTRTSLGFTTVSPDPPTASSRLPLTRIHTIGTSPVSPGRSAARPIRTIMAAATKSSTRTTRKPLTRNARLSMTSPR
jgi:hypothetical protein